MTNRQLQQSKAEDPWQPWEVAKRGLLLGTNVDSGNPAYLPLERLQRHLWLIGPTGAGKSRVLLWLFQLLTQVDDATVIVFNPKGNFGRLCRDWMIAYGLMDRLVWFDLGDPELVAGFNPLKPNGLAPSTHAKGVREGIRSAWGQASFDTTPQLQRFLYLGLAVARELGKSMFEAFEVLRAGSSLRKVLAPQLADPYLRDALQYLERLRESRQDELVSSTTARLESFVADPLIRRVITADRSIDFGEIVANQKIAIMNLELFRPHRPDDVKLLGRLMLNDLVQKVFGREDPTHPVYVIADEFHLLATADFCYALDLGRELGFHAILSNLAPGYLLREDPSGNILESVKNSARTRAVFGGLRTEDLDELVRDLFIDQIDPWRVKDEITALECEPIETTRESITKGVSQSKSKTLTDGRTVSSGQAVAFPESETIGTADATSVGQNWSRGRSTNRSHAVAVGQGHSLMRGKSEGETLTHGRAQTIGESKGESLTETDSHQQTTGWANSHGRAHADSRMAGESSGEVDTSGLTVTQLPDGQIIETAGTGGGRTSGSVVAGGGSDIDSESSTESGSESEGHAVSRGQHRSSSRAMSKSRAFAKSRSRQQAETDSETETDTDSWGAGESEEQGGSETRGVTKNRSQTRGRTPSFSEEKSESHQEGHTVGDSATISRTVSAFHAFKKRRVVTSRTFLAEAEQLTLFLQRVMGQPQAHFVVKVEEKPAVFIRAPFVEEPWVSQEVLAEVREQLALQPYYTRVEEAESADQGRRDLITHEPTFDPIRDLWFQEPEKGA